MEPQWLFHKERKVLEEIENNLPPTQQQHPANFKTFGRSKPQADKANEPPLAKTLSESKYKLESDEDSEAGSDNDLQIFGRTRLTGSKENVQPAPAKTQKGQYPRKVPGSIQEQEAARLRSFMADMRAHFAEVDAFELATTSPEMAGVGRRSRAAFLNNNRDPEYDHQVLSPSTQEVETIEQYGGRRSSAAIPIDHSGSEAETLPTDSTASPTPALQNSERFQAGWSERAPANSRIAEECRRSRDSGLPNGETKQNIKVLSSSSHSDFTCPSDHNQDFAISSQASELFAVQNSGQAKLKTCQTEGVGLGDTSLKNASEDLLLPDVEQRIRYKTAGQSKEGHEGSQGPLQTLRKPGRGSTYGLSRRSSVSFADRRNTGISRASISSWQAVHRQSLQMRQPEERAERNSFINQSRLAAARRFSVGLPKALNRLSNAGALPAASRADSSASIAADLGKDRPHAQTPRRDLRSSLQHRQTSVWNPVDFSPIAEDSPQDPSLASCSAVHEEEPAAVGDDIEAQPQIHAYELLQNSESLPGSHGKKSLHQFEGKRGRKGSTAYQEQAVQAVQPSLEATEEAERADDLQDICGPINGLEIVPGQPAGSQPTPLQQLLQICNQSIEETDLPSMDDLISQHVDLSKIKKIGEGTFGEAFKGGDVVLKIVPMDGATIVNGETQKRAEEIFAEVSVALTLNQLRSPIGSSEQNLTPGFVETFGVGICRGTYAAPLIAEWHRWDEQCKSENDPVNCFPNDQLYVVFVVANGGVDLEHFQVRSFAEARSLLLQTALTLAIGEEACEFEHRDLHWGNILLRTQAPDTLHCKLRGVKLKTQTCGLAVTLIDFTLSRLVTVSGDTAFCDLSADPALFQGPKGDCQAETYRRMKKATAGDWQSFKPSTNAQWIHYLADLLLTQKQVPATADQNRQLRNFRRRALIAKSCADLITDEFFKGLWSTAK